jgi:hypothetical protein
MKKAKIMLAVIAVVGIVGGTFAFRAAAKPNPFFSLSGGVCSTPVNLVLTTTSTQTPENYVTTLGTDGTDCGIYTTTAE